MVNPQNLKSVFLALYLILLTALLTLDHQQLNVGITTGSTAECLSKALVTSISKTARHHFPFQEQVTMVIMTYKRSDTLVNNPIVTELMPLKEVAEIVIVWNDVANPEDMQELRNKLIERNPSLESKLRIRLSKRNSLNNRFLPDDEIQTESVFIIDDDWLIRRNNFLQGFRWWQQNRQRLVGFTPRIVEDNGIKGTKYLAYHLSNILKRVQKQGYNTLLPGGGMFLHRRYLDVYWQDRQEFIEGREMVDRLFNCEDLMLNFIVPPAFHPPLLVAIDMEVSLGYLLREKEALSKRSGHTIARGTTCLATLKALFGWPFIMSHTICSEPTSIALNISRAAEP